MTNTIGTSKVVLVLLVVEVSFVEGSFNIIKLEQSLNSEVSLIRGSRKNP